MIVSSLQHLQLQLEKLTDNLTDGWNHLKSHSLIMSGVDDGCRFRALGLLAKTPHVVCPCGLGLLTCGWVPWQMSQEKKRASQELYFFMI